MGAVIISLNGRDVVDTGHIVCSYDLLLELARDGVDLSTVLAHDTPEINRYNRLSNKQIPTWTGDGTAPGPMKEAYDWKTPDPDPDLLERLTDLAKSLGPEYVMRLETEIAEFKARELMPLLMHIDWMVRDWMRRSVIWGVGRGSSCASLALYLIGLHEVDPIKYNIPLDEFLR